MAAETPSPLVGTIAYDNWRAFSSGAPLLSAVECVLYSDAWLTGEVPDATRPYRFFNLVPVGIRAGDARAAVALRSEQYIAQVDHSKMDKTEQSRYHGGWLFDEVAGLASLVCGVRFRPGGTTRTFEVDGDPKGRPVAWNVEPEPFLTVGFQGHLLPATAAEHSLMQLENLRHFPTLPPDHAIVLVRCARMYQDALWLAESEPNLGWLVLVAAVETAANKWRASADTPLERLKAAKPDLVEFLAQQCKQGTVERVAQDFADVVGATKKFVDFLLAFKPSPPQQRPHPNLQVDWSDDNLKVAFRKIYAYRSKALHDGMPFPMPMCHPPFREKAGDPPAEKPLGTATSGYGGTWLTEDTPMLLHTFEYIARGALNAWWTSVSPLPQPGPTEGKTTATDHRQATAGEGRFDLVPAGRATQTVDSGELMFLTPAPNRAKRDNKRQVGSTEGGKGFAR